MTHHVRILLLTALLTTAGGGCTAPQSQRPGPAPGAEDRGSAAQRFQDPPGGGRTPAESALALSEKYAKLSDEAAALRQENQRLAGANEDFRGQLAALETKLKQTQKELSEANELLLEMLNELNNWKGNILGFRSEMREAANAQLEALLKVLEILGGEAEAGTLERRYAGTLHPDVNDVPEVNPPSMPVPNEPNKPQ